MKRSFLLLRTRLHPKRFENGEQLQHQQQQQPSFLYTKQKKKETKKHVLQWSVCVLKGVRQRKLEGHYESE